MSTLVFGGAGFVGSHVVRKLMDEGEDVVALDIAMPDPPMPPLRDVMGRLKFEICHSQYASEVNSTVRKHRAERVINLVTSYSPDFERNPPRGVDVNLHTQLNILEAARNFGIKRVIQSSSSHVYGAGRPDVVDEESLARPDTLYGACKAMNEYLGQHYHEHFGIDHVALRFCLVLGWGRGQRKVLSHRGPWIVELFERPLVGLPVKVPFASSQGSIIYVKDLVTILLTVLRAPKLPHRLYDVVTEPRSKAQAAAIVKKLLPDANIEIDMHGAFGEARPPERMTERAWQNPLLARDFGFRERYSYETAITDYIRMAQTNEFKW